MAIKRVINSGLKESRSCGAKETGNMPDCDTLGELSFGVPTTQKEDNDG
jgi:hypothetical protein